MEDRKAARASLVLGAFFAGTGVAAGALGAHGLKQVLSPERLVLFETAVRYQMYHAFALIVNGLLFDRVAGKASSRLMLSSAAFTAGIVLFPGSLYLLSLTGTGWLGAITPLGGLCFLAGWAFLAGALIGRGNGTRD